MCGHEGTESCGVSLREKLLRTGCRNCCQASTLVSAAQPLWPQLPGAPGLAPGGLAVGSLSPHWERTAVPCLCRSGFLALTNR